MKAKKNRKGIIKGAIYFISTNGDLKVMTISPPRLIATLRPIEEGDEYYSEKEFEGKHLVVEEVFEECNISKIRFLLNRSIKNIIRFGYNVTEQVMPEAKLPVKKCEWCFERNEPLEYRYECGNCGAKY